MIQGQAEDLNECRLIVVIVRCCRLERTLALVRSHLARIFEEWHIEIGLNCLLRQHKPHSQYEHFPRILPLLLAAAHDSASCRLSAASAPP